jgi:Holliday junction DNA helicase RuvA
VIGSLRGTLLEAEIGEASGEAVVEVGGVGYRVVLPLPLAASLGRAGEPVFLHVHTHVKDDALVLYGFAEREQLRCFEALVGTHGVGPALALAILSVHSPASLRGAVAAGDIDALVEVPGVGRKTAARLLIELEASLGGAPAPVPAARACAAHSEVREALSGLGYGSEEIRTALAELPDEGATEDLLRRALKELAAAR